MHNQSPTQSQEISSFLLHRLSSTGASASLMPVSAASGMDERMMSELQKFLELERGRRIPSEQGAAPVTKLLPQAGRYLKALS